MKFVEKQFPKIPPKPRVWLNENIATSELIRAFDSASSVCDEGDEINLFANSDSSFLVGNDGNHLIFSEISLNIFMNHNFLYKLSYTSVRHLVKTFKFIKVRKIGFGLNDEGLHFEIGNSVMSMCGEIQEDWKGKEFKRFIEDKVFMEGMPLFSIRKEIFKNVLNKMGRFLRNRNRTAIFEYFNGSMKLYSEVDDTRYSMLLEVSEGSKDRKVAFRASPKKLLSLMERFQSKVIEFFSVDEYVKMRRKKGDIQLFLRKIREAGS